MPDFAADAERSRPHKTALRGRLLAVRQARIDHERRAAAAEIEQTLQALVREIRPSTVAAYVPVGSEPGGDLPSVLSPFARVLLPALLPNGDLDWVAYRGDLRPGPRGLLEPPGPRLGVDAITQAELVIVPALAVDRAGFRLGRGGGSYDRVLQRLAAAGPEAPADLLRPARPMVVALLFDGELVESVPAEPHDRRVHAVITPSGGLARITPSGGAALSPGPEWTN
jgi:5-formyltetrahydrofolate cyclo-ligase